MKITFNKKDHEIVQVNGSLYFVRKQVTVEKGQFIYMPIINKISLQTKAGGVKKGMYVVHASTVKLRRTAYNLKGAAYYTPYTLFKFEPGPFKQVTDKQWDEMYQTLVGFIPSVGDRVKVASDFIEWQKEYLNSLSEGDLIIPESVELEILETKHIKTHVHYI